MPVELVSKTTDITNEHVLIGHDLLSLISSAMYVEPLTIYRELLQNSADAIDEAVANGSLKPGEGRVDLKIDLLHRQIMIRDNGAGVQNADFATTMCAIGASAKRGEKARGFRGIGRLVGLGYAQELVFRSRSKRSERVMEAVWNSRLLRDLLRTRQRAGLAEAVAAVVTVTERPAQKDEPAHFFEVELRKIARLADEALLNAGTVERYLSEVAPVPFHPRFSNGADIARRLEIHGACPVVQVMVNGASQPITRPYRDTLAISASKTAILEGFDFLSIPAHDGDRVAAVAWIAHHQYLGAFPKRLGVRGLRARIGNLQIGDERVFAAAFPEERFADWCVGEVHILDERVVPNGRRDNFEPNLHFSNLINHLTIVGRRVAKAARTSSIERRTERGLSTVEATLRDYRKLLDVSPEAYVLRDELIADVRSEMEKARRRLVGAERKRWDAQLAKIERQINAAERVQRSDRRRTTQREMGRVDVLKLLRTRIPGGLSASAALLKLLAEEDFTR